ncbi:hypothetical protein [Microbacterium jejuense]|uniref:hypothetical protein n=1 Tax=Microbacterium jejuense TaxID=1263637 RepID=UPI0031F0E868
MAEISRRVALSLLLAAPAVLVSCSVPDRASARPTPSRTPTTQASRGMPASLSNAALPRGPLAAASFGPTGRHWPSRTPRPSDAFDLVVEAECTWKDISRCISYVAERTPHGKGCVLVKPGTLPGYGAGSSKPPVLQGIGALGRDYRVLVMPREGSASITFSDAIRMDAVKGVAFAGFWLFPQSIVLTSVQDFAWARSKGQAFNITAGGSGPASQIELVECVTPEAKLTDADVWAIRTGDNPWSDIQIVGCYLAPSYKSATSTAHCDTLQLSGSSPGADLVIRDSVIFASTNSGFIPSDRTSGIVFDHSLVVGGDRMVVRYPLPPDANAFASGKPAAVNGIGTVDAISAVSSTFVGNLRGQWLSVQNCVASIPRPPAVTSGQFSIDLSLNAIGADWLDARAPLPTDEALRLAWSL